MMLTENGIIAGSVLTGVLLALGTHGVAISDNEVMKLYVNEIAAGPGELSADELTDEDLASFLAASKSVQDVRAAWMEVISKVPEIDKAELAEDAAGVMVDAVNATGLSVEQYRQIGYLVLNDNRVAERLHAVASG